MDPRLMALLDGIVPPRGDLPGAGGLDLQGAVMADARGSGREEDLHAILGELPEGIGSMSPLERDACLRAVAERAPIPFASVVNMVYTAYYTDPRVLHALEQRTGYQASPPQPNGYRLASFDDQLLERARQRAPMWRRA